MSQAIATTSARDAFTSGGAPWWITQDGYQAIRSRLAAQSRRSRFKQDDADDDYVDPYPARNSRPYLSGSVAVVPVFGPIFRHGTWVNEIVSDCYGGTILEDLRAALAEAVASPVVRSILFAFDSPGGEVTGVADLAASIRAAASVKPTIGFAEGNCCSAAYYCAAACGEIVASSSARIGSIGTLYCFLDDSKYMETMGFEEILVVSEQSPDKCPDPTTEEGRAQYQTLANDLTDQFIADVAKYRGVTASKVASDFGRGGTFIGPAAKTAGMVDRIGTFDATLAKLNGPNRARLAVASPAVASSLVPPRLTQTARPRPAIVARLIPR